MEINVDVLEKLDKIYGSSYYIIHTEQIEQNYRELERCFNKQYSNTSIAYSYKTNYTPYICRLINELGGHAEIVSSMEYKLARNLGVATSDIVCNGPNKDAAMMEEILLGGGIVNIESIGEIITIEKISEKVPDLPLKVGIRCNFDIGDGDVSRFGLDVNSRDFAETVKRLDMRENTKRFGLHCHFAARGMEAWDRKINGMIKIVNSLDNPPTFVDVGGGFFGKMEPCLERQFTGDIPKFEKYAEIVGSKISRLFVDSSAHTLLIEPGTALVSNAMSFVTKVIDIKKIRHQWIATVAGSKFNINPLSSNINLPVERHSRGNELGIEYNNIDIAGYTCIESDYLFKGYSGTLALGDYIIFKNVGPYSVVLKPPFISPNVPIIAVTGSDTKIVKRMEMFEDIFQTYVR